MSYEICKNISIDEKKNIIKLTVASNNVYPHTFETVCYGNEQMGFKRKIKELLSDVDGGNIQPYSSVTKFMYAFYKTKEEIGIDVSLYYMLNYLHQATIYHMEGTRPHWNFKDSVITQKDIDCGEYRPYAGGYDNWYLKNSEVDDLKQRSELVMGKACECFLKHYNESVPTQKYVLYKDNYYIKPIKNGRYRYGYSKDMIKTHNIKDWMYDYKKAYVLSYLYGAKMEPMEE